MATSGSSDDHLVLVRNIPRAFRSSDLRGFFSAFVEADRVACFHFRHRPEVQIGPDGNNVRGKTCCCVVRFDSDVEAEAFTSRYSGLHWTDDSGGDLNSKCFVSRIKVVAKNEGVGENTDGTPTDNSLDSSDRKLSASDVAQLAELRPPRAIMPKGNVGTPTKFFLDAIRECRMPPKLIAKLRLEFACARSRRRYGCVGLDYGDFGGGRASAGSSVGKNVQARPYYNSRAKLDKLNAAGPREERAKTDSDADDDDDTGEEWERHESLNDDVAPNRADAGDISGQPGTKSKLYEEEMEVTWEKGGSGLVFYTDAQVWKEQEGDFDERTTDDWDVDYSVYYDSLAGDKDARDGMDMRRADHNRKGANVVSAFAKPKEPHRSSPSSAAATASTSSGKRGRRGDKPSLGSFEKHTLGFGRKIMESQGWRDGLGLGRASSGLAEAIDGAEDGQTDKAGLGYRGEAIQTFSAKASAGRKRSSIRDVIISTVYDKPEEVDPGEAVNRRNPQLYLKHRKH